MLTIACCAPHRTARAARCNASWHVRSHVARCMPRAALQRLRAACCARVPPRPPTGSHVLAYAPVARRGSALHTRPWGKPRRATLGHGGLTLSQGGLPWAAQRGLRVVRHAAAPCVAAAARSSSRTVHVAPLRTIAPPARRQRAALVCTARYIRVRETFGRRLADHQVIAHKAKARARPLCSTLQCPVVRCSTL
jgi:hypothetical protein